MRRDLGIPKLIAVAVSAVVVLWPSSSAACSSRHLGVFELAEDAVQIAVVRASRNRLRTVESLRGTARGFRVSHRAPCPPVPESGQLGLVLSSGTRLESEAEFVANPSPVRIAAVRRYVQATTAPQRRQVLVEVALGQDPGAAIDAVHLLAMRPQLLFGLTTDERRQLVQSIPRARGLHLKSLAVIMARLHELAAVRPLLARIEQDPRVIQMGISLQLLTMHRLQLHDAAPTLDEGSRWRRWYQQRSSPVAYGDLTEPVQTLTEELSAGVLRGAQLRRARSTADGWADAFREVGLRPPDRDDQGALARTMLRAPNGLLRTMAWNRCEELRGHPLAGLVFSPAGVEERRWSDLARECDSPPPVPSGAN